MNKPIHFATKLFKQYREDRDWTQSNMADFLTLQLGRNISRSAIQKWEEQERGINATLALELSKALNIPVMDLVMRKDEALK